MHDNTSSPLLPAVMRLDLLRRLLGLEEQDGQDDEAGYAQCCPEGVQAQNGEQGRDGYGEDEQRRDQDDVPVELPAVRDLPRIGLDKGCGEVDEELPQVAHEAERGEELRDDAHEEEGEDEGPVADDGVEVHDAADGEEEQRGEHEDERVHGLLEALGVLQRGHDVAREECAHRLRQPDEVRQRPEAEGDADGDEDEGLVRAVFRDPFHEPARPSQQQEVDGADDGHREEELSHDGEGRDVGHRLEAGEERQREDAEDVLEDQHADEERHLLLPAAALLLQYLEEDDSGGDGQDDADGQRGEWRVSQEQGNGLAREEDEAELHGRDDEDARPGAEEMREAEFHADEEQQQERPYPDAEFQQRFVAHPAQRVRPGDRPDQEEPEDRGLLHPDGDDAAEQREERDDGQFDAKLHAGILVRRGI